MIRNLNTRLVLILLIAALAIWVDTTDVIQIRNPLDDTILYERNIAPDWASTCKVVYRSCSKLTCLPDTPVDAAAMETARSIVENRTNALGVSENLIQLAGERRIVGEFPGAEDADAILDIIQQTGLLEFVDTGDLPTGRRNDSANRFRHWLHK